MKNQIKKTFAFVALMMIACQPLAAQEKKADPTPQKTEPTKPSENQDKAKQQTEKPADPKQEKKPSEKPKSDNPQDNKPKVENPKKAAPKPVKPEPKKPEPKKPEPKKPEPKKPEPKEARAEKAGAEKARAEKARAEKARAKKARAKKARAKKARAEKARAEKPEPKKPDTDNSKTKKEEPAKKTGNWYIRQSPAMLKTIQPIVESAKGATVKILGSVKVRSKETQAQIALGTVVDADGYILTKASELISKGKTLQVEIEGKKVPAKIHGIYQSSDIAMLKIEPAGLQISPIEWRTQPADIGCFLATPNGSGKPLGFGVLSVAARGEPGLMGVLLENVSEKAKGSRVTEVVAKSAAAEKGIAVGDIFTQVNGNEVKNTQDLIDQVRKLNAGDIVKVKIKRENKLLDFAIKLKSRMTSARLNPQETIARNRLSKRRTGFDRIIQHDTVLNPEQMGGPILDLSGRAIGINIAKNGRVATYALPLSVLGPAIEELKSGKLNPSIVYKPKLDQLVKSIDSKEKAIEKAGTRKKIADNEKQEELAKAAQEKAEKSIQELQAELADALLDRKMMEDKQKDLRAASRKIKRDLRDAEKEIEALKKEKKDIEDIFK